jgi:hypothetical protein
MSGGSILILIFERSQLLMKVLSHRQGLEFIIVYDVILRVWKRREDLPRRRYSWTLAQFLSWMYTLTGPVQRILSNIFTSCWFIAEGVIGLLGGEVRCRPV